MHGSTGAGLHTVLNTAASQLHIAADGIEKLPSPIVVYEDEGNAPVVAEIRSCLFYAPVVRNRNIARVDNVLIWTFVAAGTQCFLFMEKRLIGRTADLFAAAVGGFENHRFNMSIPAEIGFVPEIYRNAFAVPCGLIVQVLLPHKRTGHTAADNIHANEVIIALPEKAFQPRHLT